MISFHQQPELLKPTHMKPAKTNQINRIAISIGILISVLFPSCNNQPAKTSIVEQKLTGEISISGAFALYPLAVKWAEAFRQIHPDVRIDISAGGAGKGMADVLSGMVDLAMFSRGVSESEEDKGAWKIAVAKDAVLPVMNAANPFAEQIKRTGISRETFSQIYLTKSIAYWDRCPGIAGEPSKMNIYTRSDACGAAEMWAQFLGSNQESLDGLGVFGDPGIADAVKNDRLGIGYNNVIYAFDIQSRKIYDGLNIIPIDLNDNHQVDPDEDFYHSLDEVMNAIGTGKYPSPPARELYFISKGAPSEHIVKVFLQWILTEGQQYVGQAGYVMLPADRIETELRKVR